MTTRNSIAPNSDSETSTRDLTNPQGNTSPPSGARRRVLPVLLIVVAACAGSLAWWRPWETDDAPPPAPATVCDGVYETAELDRILGSQIGDYWVVHFGSASQCTIQSGKPAATNARGHVLSDTIALIRVPIDSEEYDAGNGVKWTEESIAMAADTEQDVQELDTPELEGSSYVWMRHMGSDNYIHGFWYGDGCMVVILIAYPEDKLDGPQTTQEAVDIMPELLTYIVTQAQKHDVLPTPNISDAPTTEPADTSDQASTDPTE